MPRISAGLVYVGIRCWVVALNRRDGSEVWRTKLNVPATSVSSFVCVAKDGDLVIATCGGAISALDPRTGDVIWTNPLKGLGTGLTSIAGDLGALSGVSPAVAAELMRQQAAAGAATAAAG